MEAQDVRVGKAALQFFVIAIGATAGSYLAGWATDRFFGSRRAPVICILMVVLGCLSLVYDSVASQSAPATMAILVVIGFCIYGPQVLLVGTAPADLAHRGTSAAAAGFVNFLGYMGAATGDVVTGYYSAPEHGGWQTAIYIWAAWAFVGAALAALLWNTTSRRIGVMNPAVPKWVALAALVAASACVTYGEAPAVLVIGSYAAVAALVGTLVTRWAALPALLMGLAGLLAVFSAYVRHDSSVSWDQAAAMTTYGLSAIAALMILVERKGEPCA
jgi:MFS family permease